MGVWRTVEAALDENQEASGRRAKEWNVHHGQMDGLGSPRTSWRRPRAKIVQQRQTCREPTHLDYRACMWLAQTYKNFHDDVSRRLKAVQIVLFSDRRRRRTQKGKQKNKSKLCDTKKETKLCKLVVCLEGLWPELLCIRISFSIFSGNQHVMMLHSIVLSVWSSAQTPVVLPTRLFLQIRGPFCHHTHGVKSELTIWLVDNPNPTFALWSAIYMHTCILHILWSDLIMQSKQIWQLLLFLGLPTVCVCACAQGDGSGRGIQMKQTRGAMARTIHSKWPLSNLYQPNFYRVVL